MKLKFQKLVEIRGGLSNKKVFRKYEKNSTKIVIDFSNDEEEFKNFLNIYVILKKINISVPKIYEVYSKEKLLVMEDFGDKTFNIIFNEKTLYDLLKIAVDNLIIIQNSLTSKDIKKLEKYKYTNFKKEIDEFVDYYVPYKKIKNFSVNNFYDCWKRVYRAQNFDFDSFVHKDYEFINLIFINKNNSHLKCGIIDFQNAFQGFKGWDLLSLLENPRLNFARKYNASLIEYFYRSVTIDIDYDSFLNQYYILNLARHTRLLGRWAKLINSGSKEYLKYIHSTQKRIISCLPNIKDKRLQTIYKNIL